jgi:hypothetical protein
MSEYWVDSAGDLVIEQGDHSIIITYVALWNFATEARKKRRLLEEVVKSKNDIKYEDDGYIIYRKGMTLNDVIAVQDADTINRLRKEIVKLEADNRFLNAAIELRDNWVGE